MMTRLRAVETETAARIRNRNDEAIPAASTSNVSVDEERQAVWEKIANAPLQPVGGDRVGEATSAVVPWPHQIRALIASMTIGRRSC